MGGFGSESRRMAASLPFRIVGTVSMTYSGRMVRPFRFSAAMTPSRRFLARLIWPGAMTTAIRLWFRETRYSMARDGGLGVVYARVVAV